MVINDNNHEKFQVQKEVSLWDGLTCILYSRNNPEDVIKSLKALSENLNKISGLLIGDYEIILVIDDSSCDEYLEIMNFCKDNHRVIVFQQEQKQGLGTAFYYGLGAARYSLVFLSTADSRYDFTQIEKFVRKISEFDVVIGYRLERQDPLIRRLASMVWNYLVRLLFGWRLKDIDCTYKLFRKKSLSQLHLTQLRNRQMIFNTELMTLFFQNKSKITEIPVTHVRGAPEIVSEIGFKSVTLALFRLIRLRLRLTGDKVFGYFGFVTGLYSRSSRPMEVFLYRRSRPIPFDSSLKNCPICGNNSESLFTSQFPAISVSDQPSKYLLVYCKNCQNAFTYPLPPEKSLLLKADVPIPEMKIIHRFFFRWFAVRRVGRILKTLSTVESPRVLDVGGGNCLFANSLARSNCQVVVVDPNTESEKYIDKQAGVHFISEKFSSELISNGTLKEESFDYITLWHSLQSLPDITDVFKTIRRLLKPGGYLYISTPNLASLQAEMGKYLWTYLDIPYQVNMFTPTGLLKIIQKNNLIPIRFYYFSLEYDIFGFYQTLLNLLSHSHNYYYFNIAKRKNPNEIKLKQHLWIKLITALGIIWLPLAIVLSLCASAMGKQACIEVVCSFKPAEKDRN